METPFVLILNSKAETLILQELVGSIEDVGPVREFCTQLFDKLNGYNGNVSLLNVFEGNLKITHVGHKINSIEELIE